MEGTDIFNVKLGLQIMSGIEELQFEHAQILLIFGLGMKRCF